MPPESERDILSAEVHHLVLRTLALVFTHLGKPPRVEHVRVRTVDLRVCVRREGRGGDEGAARDEGAVGERVVDKGFARHGHW